MKLPDSAQEIADVIGSEKALLLIGKLPRSYSGSTSSAKSYGRAGMTDKRSSRVNLYVPTLARLGVNHPLVQIVGWHDAVKLCKAFGGEIMYPANCACIAREFRDQAIMQMVGSGLSKSVIADQVGVSERQVRNVVRARLTEIPPEDRKTAANDNAPVINQGASSEWTNQTTRLKPQSLR